MAYSKWAEEILGQAVQDGTLRKTDEGYVITEYGRTQLAHLLTTDPRFVQISLLGLMHFPGDSSRMRALAVALGKRYLQYIHIEGLEDLMIPTWREQMIEMARENGSIASAILELVAPMATDKEEALEIGRIIADILVTDVEA